MMDWLHRMIHGHPPRWHTSGYDGFEVQWGCMTCDPDHEWDRWHSDKCKCHPADAPRDINLDGFDA